MNDYKELIKKSLEALSYAEQINLNAFYLTRADLKIIADAIEQLAKERDAAIADISYLIIRPLEVCKLCKHAFAETAAETCPTCGDTTPYGNFEWRGVQDE